MNQGLLQIGFIAGLFYTLQNGVEKLIFNKSNGNVNDYFMLRLPITTLIFGIIYFIFPRLLKSLSDNNMNLEVFAKSNYGLVIASSVFGIISIYFMYLGLSKFDVSTFSPIYLISFLSLNIIMGILLFKEPLTLNKIIGLAFAIVSIILFNMNNE